MTTKHDGELTLEKIAGKQGEYKLIPSRQAEECPFGAEFGWRVQHIAQPSLPAWYGLIEAGTAPVTQ